MAGFSNHLAQAAINHFLRNQTVTAPAAHYLALFVADPTDVTATALSNEISGAWYARQAVAFEAPVDITGATKTANTAKITFPTVTTAATTATHWGVFDALTNGNLLGSGAFDASKVLNVDDIPVINAGELILNFE